MDVAVEVEEEVAAEDLAEEEVVVVVDSVDAEVRVIEFL